MRPIAVFDTNILISALISHSGAPFRCLMLVRMGDAVSVTCQEILDEFRETLEIKFNYSPSRALSAAEEIRAFSKVVAIPRNLSGVVTDADDHVVLECALVGNATHIVTGDRRHLLPLRNYKGIAIVSAAEFEQILYSRDENAP